ncbi:MAG: hypothetical protein COA58_09000 [Bacteroidetes bacterium]|nr:MAG: hypothetical protein COA58_09000 [Bacteroidota bacterium]
MYFLGVNFDKSSSVIEFPRIWLAGLRLDLSVIGYILAVPLVLTLISIILPKISRQLNRIYWISVIVLIIIIVAVDPYFFQYWGQKTNLGFIQFLGKENAGLGSIFMSTYVIAIGFMVLSIYGFYKKGFKMLSLPQKTSWYTTLLLLGLTAIVIRGGISNVPINISSAYYSSSNLYNNTAVNSVWNFLATELEKDKHKALVFFDSNQEAQKILAENLDSDGSNYSDLVSANDSSNIILIVLESFSAKVVGFLSGNKYGSTPELDKIMKEGISFNSAYASSFRSDKGLLALTTGFPSAARQTLTNFPSKLSGKPNIFKLFGENYQTGFYYGGNLEFANISVLFNDANIVKSQKDFDSKNKNTWGVHDNTVFEIFGNDVLAEQRPQFKMLFSLSSHEPFDVPDFNRLEDPYLNSVAYTDSCLGVLIDRLKASPKWENTIVIITADHGTIRPDNAPLFDAINFKVPMVITGGLVNRDTVVNQIVSQADIPATLADLKGEPPFFNQSSILAPSGRAFYSYHDGISYVSPKGVQYYDLVQKKYLTENVAPPVERAYYQLANYAFFNP